MRHSRIKIPPAESAAAYHCISRTVNGEWLFDDVAKETFRKQLWREVHGEDRRGGRSAGAAVRDPSK
jgi:hypothetical protein